MGRWRLDDHARLSRRRIHATFGLFLLVFVVTVGQLVDIQVLSAEEHAERGVRQRARTIELPASRGRIYDREGDVLATSVTSATIYADPRTFVPEERPDGLIVPAAGDVGQVARAVAPLLQLDVAWVEERLQRDAHFVYLARQVDLELGERIMSLRLPGIGMLTEPRRVYPAGALAAQVIGFTGIDGDALQGLEARHDDLLRGTPGTLRFERALGGLSISSGMREVAPAVPGLDLVLTIDRDIQFAAERVAMDVLERYGAEAATIVVLEVGTGEILGMASAPTFDPADRRDSDQASWRNRAVTDRFEPGSIQKTLSIAAALEVGAITPATTFEVPDRLRVAGKSFSDVSKHGTEVWTAGDILARSSNVGTIMIAQRTGEEALRRGLIDFGYGVPTGLRFPGEVGGYVPPSDQWWATTLPTVSIGYGTSSTLLQLANAYAALANRGVLIDPVLVRGTVGPDGLLDATALPQFRRVVSETTAAQVLDMLGQAVEGEGATGSRARIPGYRVGGKSGTAIKVDEVAGGYSSDFVSTFVGVAPLDDPRIVVAVMVDAPKGAHFGGVVAAPAFAEVMHASLLARRIVPDSAGRSLQELVEDTRRAAERAEAQAAERAAAEPTSGSDRPSSTDRSG
jgi:cell division protein FtsI (penicillin-binding protein 3)